MRSSGILLPISALPGAYGIGSLGRTAYDFIDFLHQAEQTWWQILPIGHTGYGDSPYQCFSAFAGNPYFIDLDFLVRDDLLQEQELPDKETGNVDYTSLFVNRLPLLKKAASRVDTAQEDYLAFEKENAYWLADYALFMAVKERLGYKPIRKWEEKYKQPSDEELEEMRETFAQEIGLWKSVQYLFYTQWDELKAYAKKNTIKIVGDIPIYVSADSCEMWLHRELFITDGDGDPFLLAGSPPDKFSPSGQLWGNPLYDWNFHKASGYSWWIARFRHAEKMFDRVRIDHFRGFESFYAIHAQSSTASDGSWLKGPALDFIDAIKAAMPDLDIIAEDLGNITPEVREMLSYSGYPGMKVLQFAFDGCDDSEFLPHNYERNFVAYTGTHDNPTMLHWYHTAEDSSLTFAKKYLHVNNADDFVNASIRALYESVCDAVIIPIQDWLGLGSEGIISVPSIPDGNWKWRVMTEQLSSELAKRISDMTRLYFRTNEEETP